MKAQDLVNKVNQVIDDNALELSLQQLLCALVMISRETEQRIKQCNEALKNTDQDS